MWNDIGELRQFSSLLQWTSIGLVFVSGFLQVGKYVVDRREKALSSLEQAEKINPVAQVIHTASAVIELVEESKAQENNHYMDSGAYAALCQGSEPLMILKSIDSFANQQGGSEVHWRGTIGLDLTDRSVGKPMRHLNQTDYIQVAFGQLKSGAKITGGAIVLTINSAVRIQLSIPAQTVDAEGRLFIRDVSVLKEILK